MILLVYIKLVSLHFFLNGEVYSLPKEKKKGTIQTKVVLMTIAA